MDITEIADGGVYVLGQDVKRPREGSSRWGDVWPQGTLVQLERVGGSVVTIGAGWVVKADLGGGGLLVQLAHSRKHPAAFLALVDAAQPAYGLAATLLHARSQGITAQQLLGELMDTGALSPEAVGDALGELLRRRLEPQAQAQAPAAEPEPEAPPPPPPLALVNANAPAAGPKRVPVPRPRSKANGAA